MGTKNAINVALHARESSKLVNSREFTGDNTHIADALNRAKRAAPK